MVDDIQIALWFLLPAALGNAAPIFSGLVPYWNRWNTPLDGGKTRHGKPVLGPHKTWRGVVSGVIVATITLFLQTRAVADYSWARNLAGGVDYAALPVWLLGPLFGLGALGGDALESFFKRLRGIESGKAWFPFDQLDYIIGAILVSLPFVRFSLTVYVSMFVLWFGMHLLASFIGWLLGLKSAPI